MTQSQPLDFFFGNLAFLLSEAGMSKTRLSREIEQDEDFIHRLISDGTAPDLNIVFAIADVLKIDVADLLRPGPQIRLSGTAANDYWVERTTEEYLSSALNESRKSADHEAPTFDAMLNWWHANDGLLTAAESFAEYIEIFETPDEADLQPKPMRIGRESLSSRELGYNDPELLNAIFKKSEPDIAKSVAEAHLEVSTGQPRLSVHTILIDLSSGNVVKLSYTRLLLPVRDGNGRKYILNYSKPIRRSEIGREQINHFESGHGSKPVIAGLV